MLPVPLIAGRRGDPSLATDALFAALGLTYTRTGLMHDLYDSVALPGNYRRRQANEIVYVPVEVAGKRYPSPLLEGAATPLVSHSADATNSAWTKNANMTAALALGGLEHGPEWRGEQAVRNSEFDVDAEFTKGTGWTIAGGNAVAANVSSSNTLQQDDCFTAGKFYLIEYSVQSTTGGFAAYLGSNGNGDCVVELLAGAGSVVVGALGTNLYIRTAYGGSSNNVTINYFRATEVDAHSLLTATGATALLSRTFTRASAARQARIRIRTPATSSGSIFVSHGKPAGSQLKTNHDFATNDLTGWTDSSAGTGTVDASSGAAVLTATDSSNYGRLNGSIPTTPGKIYVIEPVTSGELVFRYNSGAAAINPVAAFSSGTRIYILATGSSFSFGFDVPDFNGTRTITSTACYEVEELEIEPGEYVDIALDEYTGANPLFAVRIPTDDDTAELYDFQGFELAAGTPPPRTVPQGATPAAVGAGVMSKSLGVSPDGIVADFLFKTPASFINFSPIIDIYADVNNRATLRFRSTGAIGLETWNGGVSQNADVAGTLSPNTLYFCSIEWTGSVTRLRINGGSWVNITNQELPSMTNMRLLQSPHSSTNYAHAPLVGFRDNDGGLLGTPDAGFNLKAIERFVANGYGA